MQFPEYDEPIPANYPRALNALKAYLFGDLPRGVPRPAAVADYPASFSDAANFENLKRIAVRVLREVAIPMMPPSSARDSIVEVVQDVCNMIERGGSMSEAAQKATDATQRFVEQPDEPGIFEALQAGWAAVSATHLLLNVRLGRGVMSSDLMDLSKCAIGAELLHLNSVIIEIFREEFTLAAESPKQTAIPSSGLSGPA